MGQKTVFLIDVDNTLINNDQVKKEIKSALVDVLGKNEAEHFWQHHDSFRQYQKYVDFPKIIRYYCAEKHKDTCELTFTKIFKNIEFQRTLYPDALKVLENLRKLGKVYLFTEGDSTYQKEKIIKSGLSSIVDGVFLFEQKIRHLPEIMKQFKDYTVVFIDDRAKYLSIEKSKFPKVITLNVKQGHYAKEDQNNYSGVDFTVDSLADLFVV